MVLHRHGTSDHHHHCQIRLLKEIAEIVVILDMMIDRHIVMKGHREDVQGHHQVVARIDHVIPEEEVPQEEIDLVLDHVIVVGKITVVEVVARIVVVIAIVIDHEDQDRHAIVEVVPVAIEDHEVEIVQDQGEMMIR